ncbi:PKD domain-containing protein [Leadbetterella sp. DM7]|uniref:PKD domain-containing protein n=1 Tax=Leadbetterella sp. DM7 TaxID=3235085 RepID=UPI00349E9C7A
MKFFVQQIAVLFFLGLIALSCQEEIPIPEADFSLAISKSEASFTNLSHNADSYAWDFGDGAGSNEQSPKHIYKVPGNYTVTLKALGAGGESSKQQSLVIHKANTKAAFSYKLQDAGNVQLVNESLEAESFVWKIPELSISFVSKDTTIKFEYNGDYTIKLEAKGFGAVDSTKQQITILSGKDYPPVPDFSFEDKGGGKYKFNNLSKNATSYYWVFGDNIGKSTEENPEYVFPENGQYKVKMEVTGKGGIATKDTVINVTSSFTYYIYTLENKTSYSIFAYNNIPEHLMTILPKLSYLQGKKIRLEQNRKMALYLFSGMMKI